LPFIIYMLVHWTHVVNPHNYPQLNNSHFAMANIVLEAIKFWHKELLIILYINANFTPDHYHLPICP
jgi:hypothetical protein